MGKLALSLIPAQQEAQMKKLKVPRGSARRLRREAAQSRALSLGIDQEHFKMFWGLGATSDAGVKVKQTQDKYSAQPA